MAFGPAVIIQVVPKEKERKNKKREREIERERERREEAGRMALGPVNTTTRRPNSGHHSYFLHSLLAFSSEHVLSVEEVCRYWPCAVLRRDAASPPTSPDRKQ